MYSFVLACSPVDKAHLKLAAAKAVVRLSRLWDQKIPVDIFHLTLRVSEVGFSSVYLISS
jgi:sister-chromatid-cohesion protein PDS5